MSYCDEPEVMSFHQEIDDATDHVFKAISLLNEWLQEMSADRDSYPELRKISSCLRDIGLELDSYDPFADKNQELQARYAGKEEDNEYDPFCAVLGETEEETDRLSDQLKCSLDCSNEATPGLNLNKNKFF